MFSELLNKAMDELKLSQADVCRLTGIGKSSMSQYLSGCNVPTPQRRIEIAEALGLEDNYFEQRLPIHKMDRRKRRLSVEEAAALMDKSIPFVQKGLQDGRFPFGYAVYMGKEWSYYISPVRFQQEIGCEIP